MSSMLEKAIVDAKALKEAALKNAENLVIEKYAEEVKGAMHRLLEVDELDPMAADPMAADPMAVDPMAVDPMAAPPIDPLADTDTEEDQDPTQGDEGAFDPTINNPDSVVRDLPDAFLADEDEIIKIKLDDLEAEFSDDGEGRFGGDEELGDDEIGIDIEDLETPAPEAPGAGEVELNPAAIAEALADMGIEIDLEEGIDDDNDGVPNWEEDDDNPVSEDSTGEQDIEVDLSEIAEALRVDIDPQKSGWAGTPSSVVKEYENMILAKENDDETKEKNKALRKRVSELQKENKIIGSASVKLQNQNEKFKNALETLQEKLESSNISNAKLLYINQTLENASLNERQKRKIVEAISKAGSVNEARMLYETLQDTIGGSNNSRRTLNSLNEAVNRRSSLLTAASQRKETRDDANPLYDRMQKLAGLKI